MVIISPHLDDAVFGCGQLMAAHPGATVIAVFAGYPAEDAPLPEWDAQCGFRSPHEAVMARREEDRRALGMLAARPVWLPFLDSQYGHSPSVSEVANALVHALLDLESKVMLAPMGLFHSDHVLVHEAALAAVRGMTGERQLRLYEDLPYRNRQGLLQQRIVALAEKGIVVTPLESHAVAPDGIKLKAAAAYASQMRVLGDKVLAQLTGAERMWDVGRADAAKAALPQGGE